MVERVGTPVERYTICVTVSVPIVLCGNCAHKWCPRPTKAAIALGKIIKTVRKCPRCQSSDELSVIGMVRNPAASEFVGTATKEELETMQGVLQIMREDFQGQRSWFLERVSAFRQEQNSHADIRPKIA